MEPAPCTRRGRFLTEMEGKSRWVGNADNMEVERWWKVKGVHS